MLSASMAACDRPVEVAPLDPPSPVALADTVPAPALDPGAQVAESLTPRLRLSTARAIEDAHQRQIEIWSEVDPRRLADWTIALSTRLPANLEVQDLLTERPHLASLFVLVPDTDLWAPAFGDSELLDTAVTVLTLAEQEPQIRWMASSFPMHLERMHRLLALGHVTAPPIFCFDRTPAGAQTYDRFLDLLLERRVLLRPDLAIRAVGALHSIGRSLRRRLTGESEFRANFERELPDLMAFIGRDLENIELLVEFPEIFDLLEIHGGLELVERRGLVVIEILFERGLEPEHRPRVVELLREIPAQSAHGLWCAAVHPRQMFQLLDQPVPAGVLYTALEQVGGDLVPARHLDYLANLSPAGLSNECAPPPPAAVEAIPFYEVYRVTNRIVRGQNVSGLDLAFATVDIATSIVPAGRGLTTAVKGARAGVGAVANGASAVRAAQPSLRASIREGAKLGWNKARARVGEELRDLGRGALDLDGAVRTAARNWDVAAEVAVLVATEGELSAPIQAVRTGPEAAKQMARAARGAFRQNGLRKPTHLITDMIGAVPSRKTSSPTLGFVRALSSDMSVDVALDNAIVAGVERYAESRELRALDDSELSPVWIDALLGPQRSTLPAASAESGPTSNSQPR
ncbi:MAG: hypothetical protein ACYSWX_11890 [Planctomycetota bacterium]|jgi:hypothetical protein